MANIKSAVAGSYGSVIHADSCVGVAQGKVPTGPSLTTLAEAGRLSNPTGLTCDSDSINRVIAQLRRPKFAKVPKLAQKIAVLQAKSDLIAGANTDLALAKGRFAAGRPGSTGHALVAATAKLDQLGGVPACPKLRTRIARGTVQTAELGGLLSGARSALKSCDRGQLAVALRRINAKRKKPAKLTLAAARISAQLTILSLLTSANASYNASDYSRARQLLIQAQIKRAASNAHDCPSSGQRITNGLASLGRQSNTRGAIHQAGQNCNIPKLRSLSGQMKRKRSRISKAFQAQIRKSIKVCKQENRERVAVRKRQKREEAARNAAVNRATCLRKYGHGYRPSKKIDSEGNFYCLPSKQVANTWCKNNNKGNGWYAIKFNGTGGFDCRRSSRAVASAARASCRRQYGSRYSHTVIKRSGSFTCHFCPRGQRAKKGRCYSRRTAQRRVRYTCPRGYRLKGRLCYPRRNSAAQRRATINAIGTIIGIIAGQGSNRGRRRSSCPSDTALINGRCVPQ